MSKNDDQLDWARTLTRGIAGAGSTSTAFALAAGAVANARALVTSVAIYPMGSGRGGRLLFSMRGADGVTCACRLWGVDRPQAGPGGFLTYIGHVALVAGTALGLDFADSSLFALDRFADTLTYTEGNASTSTPLGVGDKIGGASAIYGLGQISAYSPADNTPAMLFIAHFPFQELWVEFDVGTATSGNAHLARTG